MKKIIMALLLLIGIIGFSEEEFSYKGYDLPFTTDGKLHEEILLKREITADDTSIEIKKLKNGKYQFWDYASDTGDENEPPQISDAVKEKNVYGIGVDSNQDNLYPGIILTSMIKYVDNTVFDTIKSVVDGKFEAKVQTFGIKENGLGTTDFEFTKDKIGEENIKRLEQIKQDIKDGKIQVKSAL